jgi:hypothetical protein
VALVRDGHQRLFLEELEFPYEGLLALCELVVGGLSEELGDEGLGARVFEVALGVGELAEEEVFAGESGLFLCAGGGVGEVDYEVFGFALGTWGAFGHCLAQVVEVQLFILINFRMDFS